MIALIKFLLIQELYYGAFTLVIGISVGVQHDWWSGAKAFLFCFAFMQLIILWVNRRMIVALLLNPEIEDKK